MKVCYANIVRRTREIINGCHSESLREAECQLTGGRHISHHSNYMFGSVNFSNTLKELTKSLFLSAERGKHEFQLFAILWHSLSRATGEIIARSADCVNLLCTELSHLSLATSRKDILTHIVTRIERCRLSGRSKQRLFLVRCRIHIDREKHAVIAHMKLLYVIFHACLGCVMLRSIRHADRLHL